MRNRTVGTLIIGIALLIGFMIYLFNKALIDIVSTTCTHGSECPMWGTINFQTNLSLGIMLFVVAIGLYFIFFVKDDTAKRETHRKMTREDYKAVMQTLDAEEKEVLGKIIDSEGATFQSSLTDEQKFTKVKVTRILDKLEGKGLIERKRRGMTNIVILKSPKA